MAALASCLCSPAHADLPAAKHAGKWTNLVTWPHIQVHATLQPSDQAHSSILWWRGDESLDVPLAGGLRDWNPPDDAALNGGSFVVSPTYFADHPIPDPLPNVDIFCGGASHLPDGRVLITGGNEFGEIGLKRAVVFDPSRLLIPNANPWVPQPDMSFRRWYPTNTMLGSGKTLVLSGSEYRQMVVFGGVNGSGQQDDGIQRFGVANGGTWDATITTTGTNRPTEHEGLAMMATRREGIYALAFGGRRTVSGPTVYSNDTYRLDRGGNTFGADYSFGWTRHGKVADPSAGLPTPRAFAGLVLIEKIGQPLYMIVVDGLGRAQPGDPEVVLSDVWRGEFRPASADWVWRRVTVTGGPGPRYGHSIVYDEKTDHIFLFGGSATIGGTPTDNGVWSISAASILGGNNPSATWNSCTVTGTPPTARTEHTLTRHRERYRDANNATEVFTRAILFGGRTNYSPSTLANNAAWQLWMLTSTSVEWRPLTSVGGPPPARAAHGAAVDPTADGLAIAGGVDATGAIDPSTWFADLKCDPCGQDVLNWEHLGDMPAGKRGFTGMLNRDFQQFARVPEVFDAGTNGVGSWAALGSSLKLQDWYPFMFQLPSSLGVNRVFAAGPDTNSWSLDLNANPPAWQAYPTGANSSGFVGGSAVMFRPGEVMKTGTRDTEKSSGDAVATTKSVNLNAGSPAWVPSVNDMRYARVNHNLTLLPSGEAIVTGGTRGVGNALNDRPVYQPEIWNPDYTDPAQPGKRGYWYGANFGESVQLDTTVAVRGYHSTTLLLPDGRLFQGGGNEHPADHKTVAQYSPPYLFQANGQPAVRAKILGVRGRVAYDDTVSVVTDVAVDHFVLMRAGAVTHGFDQDQRIVTLAPDGPPVATVPPRQRVRIPADPNTLPPGPYMLFAMKADGTPSIARWLFVGQPPFMRDMGDRERPSAVTLSVLSGCSGTAAVYWNAPADDSVFAVTGKAASYDLRYATSTSGIHNWAQFDTAAQISGLPAPDVPGMMQVASVPLADGNYSLVMISRDDRAAYSQNTSPMSNELSLIIQSCSGEGTGGDPGDELVGPHVRTGTHAATVATASATVERTAGGISLFSGVPDGTWAQDELALSREPALLGNQRMVRIYRGPSGSTDLDALSLVALDHDPNAAAELLPTRAVAGALVAPLEIHDAGGRDVTDRFMGDPAACYVGDVGDSLTLSFPPVPAGGPPAVLTLTGRATARPDGEPGGLLVQVRRGDAWHVVARHHPRARLGASAVDSVDGEEVRLVFLSNVALTRAERLIPGEPPVEHALTAVGAAHSRLGQVTPGVLTTGADSVALGPADTLYAYFTPPADPAPGTTRSWFLRVRGRQSGGDGVESSRSRPTSEPTAAPPTRFALRQNVPNPFRGGTSIAFDLPVSARVSLEVFDTQGRRVRQLGGAYAPGRHSVDWDLRSDRGERVAPGVYLYRMRAGSFRAERKMIVLP